MNRADQKVYGWRHQQLRRSWALRVEAGGVTCWRCGQRILSADRWDLGHDDWDRTRYRGPEHRRCNRATSGRVKVRHSREW